VKEEMVWPNYEAVSNSFPGWTEENYANMNNRERESVSRNTDWLFSNMKKECRLPARFGCES
jgi:hypothetical protein